MGLGGRRVWVTCMNIKSHMLHWTYSRETFLGVRSWLKDVRTLANPELVMILVGNKVDKADDEREVSYLEASRFAQENGTCVGVNTWKMQTNVDELIEMMFLEASALTGDAVEEMFFKCARSILSKIETGKYCVLGKYHVNTIE